MKVSRVLLLGLVLALLLVLGSSTVSAGGGPNAGCATIQGGTITDSAGNPVVLGFDQFGYNYQAHLFVGPYSDNDRVHGGSFQDVNLQMKWNDAWLSNKDCDSDDKLDRHYGLPTYIGSGAWLTNHDVGVNEDGSTWTYFVKIVAVPVDATLVNGVWQAVDGAEIGPDIWGQFAVIQQVVTGNMPQSFIDYDLPFPGSYQSPSGSGLGNR